MHVDCSRYCTLFTNDWNTSNQELADEYLLHFRHENCYGVMVHDLNLNALSKSYSLNPKDMENPNFLQKRLFLVAWLKAVAFNIVGQFKEPLPGDYSSMQVITIVRKFIARSPILKITPNEFWVIFDPFKGQRVLQEYCNGLSQINLRIPWLGNRLLRLGFTNKTSSTKPKEMRKLITAV